MTNTITTEIETNDSPLGLAYLPRLYRQPALPTLNDLTEGFQAAGAGSDEAPSGRAKTKAARCKVVNGYLQNVDDARPWDFHPWVEGNGQTAGGFAINLTHQNAGTVLHRVGPIKHRRFILQKHDRPLYFFSADEAQTFLYHCYAVANHLFMPPSPTALRKAPSHFKYEELSA